MFKRFFKKLCFMLVCVSALSVQALNDPTKPTYYSARAEKKASFRVTSVLWSDERRVAIINGKAVSEGDEISGAKVVKIEKHQVRINQNGVLVNVKLRRPSVKQEQ